MTEFQRNTLTVAAIAALVYWAYRRSQMIPGGGFGAGICGTPLEFVARYLGVNCGAASVGVSNNPPDLLNYPITPDTPVNIIPGECRTRDGVVIEPVAGAIPLKNVSKTLPATQYCGASRLADAESVKRYDAWRVQVAAGKFPGYTA